MMTETPPIHIRRQGHRHSTKVRFNMRLERTMAAWLKKFADERDVTMTDVVVHALEDIQRRVGHRQTKARQI